MDKGGEIRGGSCIGTWRELDARKGKEAENAKGGETPLEREDERSGENWTKGRGKEAERDEGALEVPEESTRGNPGRKARGTPGPCGVCRGGSSPMCGNPCCSHL